ncbi:MAG: thiamine pyrophosphate-binding protein [Pseudomonadota bacterium]|nr:thiamine pyrophosphate-binding protein [Pseudomonadota bacterium]
MNQTPTNFANHETPVNLPANRAVPEYVSDTIADLLARMDFGYVFLLPGASYRGLHDSLVNFNRNLDPQIILATSELSAASMAHGYAKATGKPALCILHDLVGVMNGSMGLYNAYCDRAPIVFLGGAGPLDPDRRRFIEWNHSASTQADIIKNWVKWTDEPPTANATIKAILRGKTVAGTPPAGPVYISIDTHIQEMKVEKDVEPLNPELPRYQPPAPMAPNETALMQAADLILNAEFPLLVGGRLGIYERVREPLIKLLEISGAGAINDRGVYCWPSDHPQNLSGDTDAILLADVIICLDPIDINNILGTYAVRRRSDGLEARKKAPAKIIDISLNAIDNNLWTAFGGPTPPVDLQIVCEPEHGVDRLIYAIQKLLVSDGKNVDRIIKRKKLLAERHETLRESQTKAARKGWDAAPIKIERMIHEVYQAVKDKPWTLTAANHRSFSEVVWNFPGAGAYLGTDGGGGVGYNTSAAIGAALALRDEGRFCVSLGGDGDYLMAPGCIWSAAHYGVPMLHVINNNSTWGNDEIHQIEVAHNRDRPRENAWIGQAMRDPVINFSEVARGFGAWSEGPVNTPEQLSEVLQRAVAEVERGRVAVVDVTTSLGNVS